MERPTPITELAIEIYADDAHTEVLEDLAEIPYVHGFTTNPSLMRKAGVVDYATYGISLSKRIHGKPLSLEVFADDLMEMERQARIIATWGENIYVKIPISTTTGEPTIPLIQKLSNEGIKLNVTLITDLSQVRDVGAALSLETPSIVSVFAGRIADIGIDPMPIMREAKAILGERPNAKLLWASCRELFNIYQAEAVGTDIITVPKDILKKIPDIGSDLISLSRAGVSAFYEDGKSAGYRI